MHDSRRPKLGQHFLSNEQYCRRIVETLELKRQELVIEIGPGKGAMTGLLAEHAEHVVGVELDEQLARELQLRFQAESRIEIIPGDFLVTDLAALCARFRAKQCFVFGNLPYYITSLILHHVLSFRPLLGGMALLVQREVAARLEAEPGSRDYGYLSVFVQAHARPRRILRVPPGAFTPPPKVQSALVEFEILAQPAEPDAIAPGFFEFVKRCFAQKRKKLLNNLSRAYGRAAVERELARLHLASNVRAEEMRIEQFAALFARLRVC